MVDFDKLVEKIVNLRDESYVLYLKKYTKSWLLSKIEDSDQVKMIEQKFKEYDSRGVDIIEFARIMLNIIEHNEKETLYIVIALIELFKDIIESYSLTTHVKCSDVINYIIDNYSDSTPPTDHLIPTKRLPPKKYFGNSESHVREIETKVPIVYGDAFGSLKRLSHTKLISDRVHHKNNSIKGACYATEIKKIFVLDSLAMCISVYNPECIIERQIYPKVLHTTKDTMIMNFTWSKRQCRLAACLKDFRLVFWDSKDNFKLEKSFSVAEYLSNFQSNIWYIEFLNLWVTTDKTNQIHAWNVPEEALDYSVGMNSILASILDIVSIDIFKLVAVSCLDKTVSFWDLTKREKRFNLSLSNAGVHSLRFFDTFQVLITAGYENTISLWSINYVHSDYAKIGRLIGHSSMVTAIEPIEKTPMVISADDIGDIKVWDIRNLSCVQTLETGSRTVITQMISLYNIAKICFVGSHVNVLEFENAIEIKNKAKRDDPQWPVRIEYNFSMNEFVLCTNKEIRFIDVTNGRVKKVYAGLLGNNEEDITVFRLLQQNKKFILGDQRGNMNVYLYATGELLTQINGHTDEVSAIKIDYLNRLIISSSWDSSVIIQKEVKDKFKVLRRLNNCFNRKEVSLMEVSVYHNLLITGAPRNNTLYLWDYEYIRLVASIDIEDDAEPTFIQIINGFAILIISTSIGTVHFFHFSRKDATHITIKNIAILHLNKTETSDAGPEKISFKESSPENTRVVNKMLLDVTYNLEDQTTPKKSYLYLGLNKGAVIKYDLQCLFAGKKIALVPHANTRLNYNADRITTEDFEEVTKNYKIHSFYLRGKAGHSFSTFGFAAKMIVIAKNVQQKTKIQTTRPEEQANPHMRSRLTTEYRRNALISSRNKEKSNPATDDSPMSKFEREVLVSDTDVDFLDLSDKEIKTFQAHKDTLTTLSFITIPDKKLLTSSLDYYYRIWDLDGKLVASVNINHPLPILWNFETLTVKQARKRVMYGLKITENILKRHEKKLSLVEEKVIDLNPFLTQIEQSVVEKDYEKVPLVSERQKLTLMKDEYDPRDIQYEKVKGIYQHELQGPSLKQMEIEKRLKMAHKTWKAKKIENTSSLNENTMLKKIVRPKESDSGDYYEANLMKYLLGNQNTTNNQTSTQESAGQTKKLAKKLDAGISSKKLKMQPDESTNRLRSQMSPNQISKRKILDHDSEKISYLLEATGSSVDEGSFEEENSYIKNYKRTNAVNTQSGEESKSKSFLKRPIIRNSQALPIGNKDLSSSRDETKITYESTKKIGQAHNLKTSKFINDSDYYETRTDSKALLQDNVLSRPTKKTIPSLTFLDYAGQKHLLVSGLQSVRTSTDENAPDYCRRKEQKSEFRQVLSSLERHLKKAQASDTPIHFETIMNQTQKRLKDSTSERLLPEINPSKSKSNLSKTLKGIKTALNDTPYLDFTQNSESFIKNMNKMIEDMKQAAQENVPEKVAKLMQQKIKMQAQFEMGLEYEELHTDGKNQDFMTLDFVFKKAGATGDDLKKGKTIVSLQNVEGDLELVGGPKSINRSMAKRKTRTVKTSEEIESELTQNQLDFKEIGAKTNSINSINNG